MSALWAVPVAILAMGAVLFGLAVLTSWRSDRRHPHLTRAALRDRTPEDDA